MWSWKREGAIHRCFHPVSVNRPLIMGSTGSPPALPGGIHLTGIRLAVHPGTRVIFKFIFTFTTSFQGRSRTRQPDPSMWSIAGLRGVTVERECGAFVHHFITAAASFSPSLCVFRSWLFLSRPSVRYFHVAFFCDSFNLHKPLIRGKTYSLTLTALTHLNQALSCFDSFAEKHPWLFWLTGFIPRQNWDWRETERFVFSVPLLNLLRDSAWDWLNNA